VINVVIPTIKGRESYYRQCVESYERNTADDINILTVIGEKSCGEAWQKGSELIADIQENYLHFAADDLTAHPDWDVHARECADEGMLPAPYIYNGTTNELEQMGVMPDGFFTRIPFCTVAQWKKIGPMIPIHYYTDNYFSWRGANAGFETVEVPSYRFSHHWAQAGRYATQKMAEDHAAYERYKREGYAG
jgi:hypothetical protein